jgi:hypothetical protein
MPLWPSSSTQTFSATGSVALPSRSRATAYLSRSEWNQDAAILPFTINTAIAAPALERSSVEGEAAVTSSLLRFTSRPVNWAWFNANFRYYDFDNRTPVLNVPIQVKYDQAVQTATVPETEPLSFTRDILELEGSFTPLRHGALRIGYTREGVDRAFRFLDETVDHTVRVAYDVTSLDWITLRAAYNRSKRTGAGLDEEAFSDIGEQVSLRQFDIADRVRNQGTLIVTVMPSSLFSVNAWIGGGTDDRPDAQFGLTDTSLGTYSVGVDAAPRDGIAVGLTYGYETFTSLQNSRQANPPPSPQFTDPTRDWSTDAVEKVHTVTVALDVLNGIPNTELRLGYDYNRSRSTYAYELVPNSTLITPVQLPAIRNACSSSATTASAWTTSPSILRRWIDWSLARRCCSATTTGPTPRTRCGSSSRISGSPVRVMGRLMRSARVPSIYGSTRALLPSRQGLAAGGPVRLPRALLGPLGRDRRRVRQHHRTADAARNARSVRPSTSAPRQTNTGRSSPDTPIGSLSGKCRTVLRPRWTKVSAGRSEADIPRRSMK